MPGEEEPERRGNDTPTSQALKEVVGIVSSPGLTISSGAQLNKCAKEEVQVPQESKQPSEAAVGGGII